MGNNESVPDDLAERAKNGDKTAFDTLFLAVRESIFRTLLRMVHNSDIAEELTHETYCRAQPSITTLKEPSRLKPWLFATARHIALDYFRKHRREEEHMTVLDPQKHDVSVEWEDPERMVVSREELFDLLDRLKPHMRAIVIMSAAGFTVAEIIARCAMQFGQLYTEEAIYSKLCSIRQKLRKGRAEQKKTQASTDETRKGI